MKSSNSLGTLALVAATLALAACGGRKSGNSNTSTFRVESIAIDKVATQKQDASQLNIKTKVYNFSACVQDEVLRQPIIRTQFAVSDGVTEIPVKSDNNGCLLWSETHQVDYYQTETLFEVSRHVIAKETYEGKVSVRFAFNPWNDGEALMDLRKQRPVKVPQKIETLGFSDSPSVFLTYDSETTPFVLIPGIELEFVDLDFSKYKVNSALTLSVAHKFRVKFNPMVSRRTLDEKRTLSPLTEGSFRVRMFLLSASASESPVASDLISIAETIASINPHQPDGKAIGTISLSISDISLVASKMKVLVEVTPLSLGGAVKAGYSVGLISALKANSASVDLELAPEKTVRAVEDLQKPNALLSLDPMKTFETRSGLVAANPAPLTEKALQERGAVTSPYDFKAKALDFLEGRMHNNKLETEKFKKALCLKVYSGADSSSDALSAMSLWSASTPLSECIASPDRSLDIVVRSLVTQVNNSVPKPVGVTQEYSLSVSNSFDFSTSESSSSGSSTSKSFGIGGDLGLGFSLPDASPFSAGANLKIGIGKDWYSATKADTATGKSTSAGLQNSLSISAVANSFEIDVNFKRCLLFGAKTAGSTQKTPSFYICSAKEFTGIARETYYFVNQSVGASPFTDPDSPSSTKWRMTLRGTAEFDFFRSLVSNPNIVMHFTKYSSEMSAKTTPDFNVTQSFPGMLSTAL